MLAAYRGYSVILFAPVAALGAVLLTMPGAVLPAFSALFMESMATFMKNYASSVESVGEFWLGKLSEHMIQGEFSHSERAKPVGFSHGDFGFVVEPLDNAA